VSLNAGGRVEGALDPEFERFAVRCSAPLMRTALLLAGDQETAEDLLQLTLLRVGRRWSAARDSPTAYAQRVLVNLSRDERRRARRRPSGDPIDEAVSLTAPRDHFEAVLARDAVVRALRRLPSRQREVVVLRFYADMSIVETAAAMRTSEGTVKSYTARAGAHAGTPDRHKGRPSGGGVK
jgi:RNA polymerase sigma factor (sigma-70 family)